MLSLSLRFALAFACVAVGGYAALMIGSGIAEDDIIHVGTTEAQLTRRLGAPIRKDAV